MEIIFEQISYTYAMGTPFEKEALKDISLHIPSGQFVALMGHTGSGKTTLAQMINGLLRPTTGNVKVADYTIGEQKQDLRALRAHIGYSFQYPEHQLFEETVFQDISFSLRQLGYNHELIPARVKEALEMVGLSYDEFHERSPFQLSGGQMRRVALAGVLVIQPQILILDEPTAGLDPLGRLELLTLIRKLHQEKDMTIIYITHHLEEALEYAERLVVMKEGSLYADLLIEEVPRHLEQLTEAGLLSTPFIDTLQQLQPLFPETTFNNLYREEQLISFLLNNSTTKRGG